MVHHQKASKTSAKLDRYTIHFDNTEEYHRLKREVFTEHLYYFETENPQPVIIDAGAHIGMATLYFKKIFPDAQVIAIEPHPASFQLLETNVWENGLNDVTCHQVALAARTGETTLFQDASDEHWYSTASFLSGAWNGDQKSVPITVNTVPLTDYLTQPIECLKMDIEGAEYQVLHAAGEKLQIIKHMFIEFHPHAGQDIKLLLELLEKNNFEIKTWKKGKLVDPLTTTGLRIIEATHRSAAKS